MIPINVTGIFRQLNEQADDVHISLQKAKEHLTHEQSERLFELFADYTNELTKVISEKCNDSRK